MIFLPEEETCFHLYEAASVGDVREAAARAGIGCERVVDAVDLAPKSALAQATTQRRETKRAFTAAHDTERWNDPRRL
jgi:hypothetical protein